MKTHGAPSWTPVLVSLCLCWTQIGVAQDAGVGTKPGLPYAEERYRPPKSSYVLSFSAPRLPSSGEVSEARDTLSSVSAALGTLAYEKAVENGGWELGSQIPPIKSGAQAGGNAPFIEVVEIEQPKAIWIRLTFKEVDLQNAVLKVTSQNSKRQQTFNSKSFEDWEHTTAIFDGNKVRVLLQTRRGAGYPTLRLQDMIDTVSYGTSVERVPYPGETLPKPRAQNGSAIVPQSACEKDTRQFSTNKLVGRMRPAACTAFLVEGGIAATAGHCLLNGNNQYVAFNVPHSDQSGTPMEPDLDTNAYKVVVASITCSNCRSGDYNADAHGNDWAVFRLSANTRGETAQQRQGPGYVVHSGSPLAPPAHSLTVLLFGFGWDTRPPEASYASQQSIGPLVDVQSEASSHGILVHHLADTAPGSSGSPIILRNEPNEVIGIHVAGSDCEAQVALPNVGASFMNTALMKAVQALRTPTKEP